MSALSKEKMSKVHLWWTLKKCGIHLPYHMKVLKRKEK